MNSFRLKLHKLTHWEYWPMQFIYAPVFPFWLYFALKARSFFFFNAANPSIKNGGMAMESKKDIYDLIPEDYIPKTVYIPKTDSLQEILNKVEASGIQYPLIVKPDIGLKALGVDTIYDKSQFAGYIEKFKDDFLIQERINFPNELGIFYYRIPGEQQGAISGIVSKEFLSVTGNGKDSILSLARSVPRSALQIHSLEKLHGGRLHEVLAPGEKFILVPYGSHTRGAAFSDVSDRNNKALTETIDKICQRIPGFFYGRLDIRYNTLEELGEAKNFSVIEINGAGSEPTHIYDPRHSILFAWKEIVRHWNILYRISAINYKAGHPYLSFNAGREMMKANQRLETSLRLM